MARDTFSHITPLHAAADAASVETLVAAGADANARDRGGNTPLHTARDAAVVEALVAAGADPTARTPFGFTPLFEAAAFGAPALIEALLTADASVVNARTRSGRTALHHAAQFNIEPAVIALLLGAGANLEARDDEGQTPLHHAAENNRTGATARALLAAGAGMEARDENGNAPLHVAAKYVSDWAGPDEDAHAAGVIEALLEAGADATARNAAGQTPWDLAQENETLRGSDGYWRLNDARFNASEPDARRRIATPPPGNIEQESLRRESAGAPRRPDDALRSLEASCGETYRSGFSEQDHWRFHCLDAFGRHCALKQGHNEQHLDALKRDFEVLRGIGVESQCPYFEVFGVSYSGDSSAPPPDRAAAETTSAQEPEDNEEQSPRPTCADGGGVPNAVLEGRMTVCTPELWCRYRACETEECRRRYRPCEPGVLQ